MIKDLRGHINHKYIGILKTVWKYIKQNQQNLKKQTIQNYSQMFQHTFSQ